MGSQEALTNVLITGFGPFDCHDVNASWEAVKELTQTGISPGIRVHSMEVPVDYQYVMNEIPKLYSAYKPDLIINVGVSGVTEVVQIETCAHKTGYKREDINGCIPDEYRKEQECLKTSIDLHEVIRYCKMHQCCCEIETSEDAGRYLCEFIYYTSLNCEVAPALFIHVPCLNMPYSKVDLAEALRFIILGAIQQLPISK